MNCWLLRIQICGEWEECVFTTKADALAAFIALATDYSGKLERAVLVSPQASGNVKLPDGAWSSLSQFVN